MSSWPPTTPPSCTVSPLPHCTRPRAVTAVVASPVPAVLLAVWDALAAWPAYTAQQQLHPLHRRRGRAAVLGAGLLVLKSRGESDLLGMTDGEIHFSVCICRCVYTCNLHGQLNDLWWIDLHISAFCTWICLGIPRQTFVCVCVCVCVCARAHALFLVVPCLHVCYLTFSCWVKVTFLWILPYLL